jgi:HlyD family secretion protein
MAKSNLDQNEDLLSNVIYSPMDGVISIEHEIGERVVAPEISPERKSRVANFGSMEVGDVNENDVVDVEVGIPCNQGRRLSGQSFGRQCQTDCQHCYREERRTSRKSPTLRFESRWQTSGALRPGMSASVEIETQTAHHVVRCRSSRYGSRRERQPRSAQKDREKQTGVV